MIAFFGASVTAQRTSYAKVFEKKIMDDVIIFGYGGMHLNNAGICFLDDIVAAKPSYCFVDFFSTAYEEQDQYTKLYINTILYKMAQINCKVIFLFLPKKTDSLEDWHNYCKKYLNELGSYYIDVNAEIMENIDEILRDDVHTTTKGSSRYADIIYENFSKNKDNISMCTNISPNKYCFIKFIEIEKMYTITKPLKLRGNVEVVGILNTIGPFSGLIEIRHQNSECDTICIWDQWCSYARKHFNLSCKINTEAELVVLSTDMQTSICKLNRRYRKKFILHRIYYLGDRLDVLNIYDGLEIPNIDILLLNIKSRLLQKISNYLKRLMK